MVVPCGAVVVQSPKRAFSKRNAWGRVLRLARGSSAEAGVCVFLVLNHHSPLPSPLYFYLHSPCLPSSPLPSAPPSRPPLPPPDSSLPVRVTVEIPPARRGRRSAHLSPAKKPPLLTDRPPVSCVSLSEVGSSIPSVPIKEDDPTKSFAIPTAGKIVIVCVIRRLQTPHHTRPRADVFAARRFCQRLPRRLHPDLL